MKVDVDGIIKQPENATDFSLEADDIIIVPQRLF